MHGFLFMSLYSLITRRGGRGTLQGASWGTPWHLGVGVAIPRAAPLDARATPQSAPEARDTRTSLLHGPRGQLGQGVRGLPQYT